MFVLGKFLKIHPEKCANIILHEAYSYGDQYPNSGFSLFSSNVSIKTVNILRIPLVALYCPVVFCTLSSYDSHFCHREKSNTNTV